ncbi:hypothetical protein [Streptomyces sp. NPDC054887]
MGIQRLSTDGTPGAEREEPKNPRLDLSVAQVAGSAVAAVVGAVLASKLGVYGTIVGAGVVSVVATSGGTLFQHLFRRTGEQLREVTVHARPKGRQVPARGPGGEGGWTRVPPTVAVPAVPTDGRFNDPTTHGTRVRGWKRSLVAALVVFVVAMGGITAYELVSGGDLSGGRGSTVGNVLRGGEQHRGKTPPSPSPSERSPGVPPASGTEAPGRDSGATGTEGGGAGASPDTAFPAPPDPATTPPATPDGGASRSPASPPTPTPSAGAGDDTAGDADGGATDDGTADGDAPDGDPSP